MTNQGRRRFSLEHPSKSASRKKAIVRKLTGEWFPGYLPSSDFLDQAGLRVLDVDGKITEVFLSELKWVCFVRDFPSSDHEFPEQLVSKTFSRRPRAPGLWVRARLKDDDRIEGVMKNDVSLLDSHGVFLIPPDVRSPNIHSNAQRIFLPRPAIKELEILAVVRAVHPGKTPLGIQGTLFHPQSGAF